MIHKLLHTRFRVLNLEKSIAFYTNTFGLRLRDTKTSPRGSKLAFLTIPDSDAELELCEFLESGPIDIAGKDIVHIAFGITSFEVFTKHIESIGVQYSDLPNGRFAFIDDPDGYEIEIIITA